MRYSGHSHFDGEGDRSALVPAPTGGIAEQQLMFWARGMAEPILKPGEKRNVLLRRSLQYERHPHREARWSEARLSRATSPMKIEVPAGEFVAEAWRAELEGGFMVSFIVERDAPHRILEWSSSEGERAVPVGSDRLKYWQMNQPGGESALSSLGLRTRAPRTP